MSRCWRPALSLLALVACEGVGPPPGTAPPDPGARIVCPPGGGPNTLEVHPAAVTAGAEVTDLRFEFRVPATINPLGLPSDTADNSIIQLELPNSRFRDDVHVAEFDQPRFCARRDVGCVLDSADGYWEAWLLPQGVCEGGPTIESPRWLRLGLPYDDVLYPAEVNYEIIGVYADLSTPALIPGDVVQLLYRGHAPRRATDWRPDIDLRANLRYRDAGGAFVELDRAEVTPLVIESGALKFVHLVAPLDIAAGDGPEVEVVGTDAHGNPASLEAVLSWEVAFVTTPGGAPTAYCQLAPDGFLGSGQPWRATCAGDPIVDPGEVKFVVSTQGEPNSRVDPVVVSHWTKVHPADGFTTQRVVGDTHIHTGLSSDSGPATFLGSYKGPGDHHRQTADAKAALEYVERVAGYDFASVANHSVEYDGWSLPASVAADPAWAPGGACELDSEVSALAIADWWTRMQIDTRTYQEGNDDFWVFPGYEWHSQQVLTGNVQGTPRHRVVLFRDFDPLDALPLLPGSTLNRPPQCLVNFVKHVLAAEASGNDAIVIPHMMTDVRNEDMAETYGGGDAGIATRLDMETYHRIGEVFSARAYDGGLDLTGFEGDDSGDVVNHTFQTAWKTWEAEIGLIGSSDNHAQMPGVNDDGNPDIPGGYRGQPHNEPTGTAFVLTSPAPTRADIFEGMSLRHTYATSGLRVWMDLHLTDHASGSTWTMGDSVGPIALTCGSAVFDLEVLSGSPATRVELVHVTPGASGPWTVAPATTPLGEVNRASWEVGATLGLAPGKHVVYARAFFEDPALGTVVEAAWSSPIWLDVTTCL